MSIALLGEASFELPGGLFLDADRAVRTVVLRPLLGYEEEWLAQASHSPSAANVTRLLSSCLVSACGEPVSTDLVRKLLVGDRDYLMLQLRRLSLGDDVNAVLICPACDKRIDVSFRSSNTPVDWRVQEAASHEIVLAGRKVRFRLPTGGDQESLLGMEIDEGAEELLNRCVLDEGGQPLSTEERNAVVDEMERRAPQVDLELELACPECGHSFVAPFDLITFFFDEIRAGSKKLLREVHTLAFYYHWSESEILSLRRSRRREYLGLLNEALRQD